MDLDQLIIDMLAGDHWRGSDADPVIITDAIDSDSEVDNRAIIAEMARLHREALVGYANKFVRDSAAAEDIIQELFVTLMSLRKRLDVERNVVGFLYRVCQFRIRDARRRRKMSRFSELGDEDFNLDPADVAQPAPDVIAEQSEMFAALVAKLPARPAKLRQCFRLRFQVGLDNREIARHTGLTVTEVSQRIDAGLAVLRQHFNT